MSLNSSGIVNSNEGGLHLMVRTDESWTALSLYIAPPPSRHDTQQIPVARSLGLCRRNNTTCLTPRFLGTAEHFVDVRAEGNRLVCRRSRGRGVMRWITDEKTVPLFSKIAVNGLLVENAGQTYTSSECIR